MGRIAGKIALITGAARGIGAETARLFVKEGAFVILTDVLDDLGQALVAELGADKACYFQLDVSDEKACEKIDSMVRERYKKIDILFNNAGITGSGVQDPENATLKDWHQVHSVNLDGIFLGCKIGISLMKERGGSIVNMSSRSGLVGIPTACAYASSKAAVRNHTKSVALYCADKKYGIRCNSVHPAAILTPLWEPMLGDDQAQRERVMSSICAGIPVGHMGESLDVAYAVLFLASDESKYITGTELTIDGGILAGSSASYKQGDQ